MNNEANKIDTLPDVLIGEIASHLNQTDYHQFSVSNKAISCGCNSPKTLQCINLLSQSRMWNKKNNSRIHLEKYPFLKSLSIDINQFAELILPQHQQSSLHQLKHVTFAVDNNSDIQPFITQNRIDLTKVTTLKLFNQPFMDESVFFDREKFWILLSKFPNIEHMIVEHLDISDEMMDDQHIKALMAKLKSLKWKWSSPALRNKLMTLFANNLESLQLSIGNSDEFEIETNIKFPKLEELWIGGHGQQQFEQIANKSLNLKTVHLGLNIVRWPENHSTERLYKLLFDHPSLKYIRFSIVPFPAVYKPMLNDIGNLFKMQLQQRDIIRIGIDIVFLDHHTFNDLMIDIKRLIFSMANSELYAAYALEIFFNKTEIGEIVAHFGTTEIDEFATTEIVIQQKSYGVNIIAINIK